MDTYVFQRRPRHDRSGTGIGRGTMTTPSIRLLSTLLLLVVSPVTLAFRPSSGHVQAVTPHGRTSTDLQASLEAILFDCDGVLADTERDGHR